MIFLDLGYQPLANEYLKNTNSKEKNIDFWLISTRKAKLFQLKKNSLAKKCLKIITLIDHQCQKQ